MTAAAPIASSPLGWRLFVSAIVSAAIGVGLAWSFSHLLLLKIYAVATAPIHGISVLGNATKPEHFVGSSLAFAVWTFLAWRPPSSIRLPRRGGNVPA